MIAQNPLVAFAAALLLSAQGALADSPAAPQAPGASPAPTAPPAAAGPVTLRVEPATIDVGMFYKGTKVHVEGSAPAGAHLALVCVGKESKVELKRKGKVWNALWMNVGSVAFERVPSLFQVSADLEGASLQDLVAPGDLRLGLGYDGIESLVLPRGADENTRHLFREFIRLKTQEQLYYVGKLHSDGSSARPTTPVPTTTASVQTGSPPVASDFRPTTHVSADFSLPANTPPGVYEIRMIGYHDGVGELLATEKVVARRVGLAAFISTMALQHGLVYGVFSVVLALVAGFVTGFVFASAKKGH